MVPNPGLRNQVNSELRALGVTISKSTGIGQATFDELKSLEIPVDTIFLDTKLTDTDAQTFVEALREHEQFNHVHIFLMYDPEQAGMVMEVLPSGLTGVIKKPLNRKTFAKEITNRMGKFQLYSRNYSCLHRDTIAHFFEGIKQYQNALKYYQEIADQCDLAQCQFDIGRLASLTNEDELAKQAFEKAITLDGSYRAIIKKYVGKLIRSKSSSQAVTKIPKEAIDMFYMPFERVKKGFYGIQHLTSILVVGENHQERVRIKSIMADNKIKSCQTTPSGEEAFQLIQSHSYDLVIVNIFIADMNGLQFIEALQRNFAERVPKILLLLEESLQENIYQAIDLGIDGYASKPYTMKSVCHALHTTMLQDHITCESGAARALLKQSYFLQELGLLEDAKEKCMEASKAKPGDGVGSFYLASILHQLGDVEGAKNWYQFAVDANPCLAPLCKTAVKDNERIRAQMAKEQEEQREQEAPLESISESLDEDGEDLVIFDDSSAGDNANTDDLPDLDMDLGMADIHENSNEGDMPPPVLIDESEGVEADLDIEDDETDLLIVDDVHSEEQPGQQPPDSKPRLLDKISLEMEPSDDGQDLKIEIDHNITLDPTSPSPNEPANKLAPIEIEEPDPPIEAPKVTPPTTDDLSYDLTQSSSESHEIDTPQESVPQTKIEVQPANTTPPPTKKLLAEGKGTTALQPQIHLGIDLAENFLDTLNHLDSEESSNEIDPRDLFQVESLQLVDSRIADASKARAIESFALGVSTASFPQVGNVEQVYRGNPVELNLAGGNQIRMLGSEVTEWMPQHKFRQIMEEYGRAYELDQEGQDVAQEALLNGALKIVNQSRLFQSRLSVSDAHSSDESEYLQAIGRTFSEQHILQILDEKSGSVSRDLIKMAEKAESKQSSDLYEKLGKKIVHSEQYNNFLDEAQNTLNYALSHPDIPDNDEAPYSIKQVEAFKESIYRLNSHTGNLHQSYLDGKDAFRNQLDYLITHADEKPWEMYKLASESLKTDHYSLESFKSLFSAMTAKDMPPRVLDKLVRQFLKKHEKDPNALSALADHLIAIGDYDRASKILKQIIKKMRPPEVIAYLRKMASVSFKNKKFSDAIYWARRIISYDPGDEHSFNIIGVSYKRLERLKASIKSYRRGIKHNPMSHKLHYNLAIALANMGQDIESQEILQRSKELKNGQSNH